MARAFDTHDLEELRERGIDPAAAERQLELLRHPPRPIALDRPATVGDGIHQIDAARFHELESVAERAASARRVMTFVPASGAATRMFKDLRAALDADAPAQNPAAKLFFESLDAFPFADDLRRHAGVSGARTPDEQRRILRALLDELGYAETPKGLIPFHRTAEGTRTPFEEHLLQARRFARAADGSVRAHFTVAAEHVAAFERELDRIRPRLESDGARLRVDFSVQEPSTDVLALDPAGEPFRTAEGALLFRPSGHGALLGNLERAGGDLVSIRNIDNVVPDEASADVVRWKKLLVGTLAEVQREAFAILEACANDAAGGDLDRGIEIARARFGRAPAGPLATAEKAAFVRHALDRPLRVCGVVRNEGEPGGAPFWTVDREGRRSLQIVEASQVDMSDPAQKAIFASSTHFNPVDIAAGMRRWNGDPFELERFVDADAVVVSKTSYEGRDLLALERPGLWNGAMAGWNTLFVEVPAPTFAPVKTVLDLLRPIHQQ
ncbi:MAG TPA: DUF4301 family protein [Thermoanaerobaculia bacterium]